MKYLTPNAGTPEGFIVNYNALFYRGLQLLFLHFISAGFFFRFLPRWRNRSPQAGSVVLGTSPGISQQCSGTGRATLGLA